MSPKSIKLEPSGIVPRDDAVVNVLYGKGCTPYIWIGDAGGLYASLTGRAKLRRLRDEITKALRRKP